jgi:hypothetical protein
MIWLSLLESYRDSSVVPVLNAGNNKNKIIFGAERHKIYSAF